MEDNKSTERTVEIDDPQLFEMVLQKGSMVDEGRELSREMERLSEEHRQVYERQNVLITKVNDLKLDIIARLKEVAGHLLGEFEVPVTTEIKDGKLVFTIADSMAEFQNTFKTFDKWKAAAPVSVKTKAEEAVKSPYQGE